jgi:hypothetical protein
LILLSNSHTALQSRLSDFSDWQRNFGWEPISLIWIFCSLSVRVPGNPPSFVMTFTVNRWIVGIIVMTKYRTISRDK